MFIFIYIVVVNACSVQYDEQYLYPTEGEILEITLDKFIQGSNLTYVCQQCQQGISLQNIFKREQISKNNYTFKSVSFHNDLIFALTTNSTVNIYMKINEKMEHTPLKIIQIPFNQLCLSVTYADQYNIILDCYQDQTLFLYSLTGINFSQIYTSNSSTPNQTKINFITNNSESYIIYGQFFTQTNPTDYNSTLLNLRILYSQQGSLRETDNLQDQAYNFFVSKRESVSQAIFISYSQNVKVYVLSQSKTFQLIKNIQFNYLTINMAYYYSKEQYYQFDRLFVIAIDDDLDYMYFIDIYYSDQFDVQILESKQQKTTVGRQAQIFISKQFIVIQNNNIISILNNERFNQIIFSYIYAFHNTVIYFDEFREELFIFSEIIQNYKLQVPVLNFASIDSKGKFIIQALEVYDNYKIQLCNVKIKYQYVDQLDSNIYFKYKYQQQSYYNLLQLPFVYWIDCLSGPLVKVVANVSNPQLGSFKDNTLQQTNQSLSQKQKYYMVKAFSVNLLQECKTHSFSCIFVVAVNTQNMDLYEEGIKLPVSSIEIGYMMANVTQIEITFSVQNRQLIFIICLSFGKNTIQLYNYITKLEMITTLNTEPFQQFQLLSNSVVLLLNSNQIAIATFGNRSEIIFSSSILEQMYGQKIVVNLISIFINQQYQSRVLYINNKNSFIIGYITETLKFVLISIQHVDFQIQNLQVVNNLLVMSWYPQESKVIHFEVWNVEQLTNPKKKGKMRSINYELDTNYISQYSDNQFLYVQIGSNLNVYNPNLPEHSSHYYRIPFDGLYFTSIAIDQMAFLCFNQSFNLLSPILLQTFQNNTIHQNFFTTQIFNFTYYSFLDDYNPINQSNSSVTIINDYLYIDLNKTEISVKKSQQHVEIFRDNISFSGQALQFSINNKSENSYQLSNYIEYSKNHKYDDTYNLIIQYNKTQFMLMNNQKILNYTSNQTYQFNSSYKKCLASAAQNLTIYALCQNNNSQYQIISINVQNQANNILYPNLIVDLMNQIYTKNASIRIQDNQLYIWNETIQMYFINQGQSQKVQFICRSTQFGFQTTQIQEGNTSTIIYFYFKPIHKDQLYYKFAQLKNNYQLDFGVENFILLKSITQQFYSFDTIPMIIRNNKEIVLMISNSNFNLVVSFLLIINKSKITASQIIFQSIIQTSPPFEKHNFSISQPPQYDQGLLLFMYSNASNISYQTHMITFYNISNFKNFTFSTPLLFQGGYNFTLNSTLVNAFSLIAYNNSSGTILVLFNNGSILELLLNIFSIKVNLTESRNQTILNLAAYNYYDSGNAEIIFKIQQTHLFDAPSFYILFGVTIIVLVLSLLTCSFNQKGNSNDEDNFEDEL